MSNEKTTISKEGPTPLTPMEVEELEIDENDDFGSDPYNRTGSHCVLELGEDA